MSDEQDYEEDDYGLQQQQEDIQTKVQLDFYEALQLNRKGQIKQAVASFKKLYQLSEENNLRTWKTKILTNLLEIFCRNNLGKDIQQTLQSLVKLHKTSKISQASVKSIISILKVLEGQQYSDHSQQIMNFVEQMQPASTINGYIFMLQKSLNDKNQKQAQRILKKIKLLTQRMINIPAEQKIALYYLQIKYSRLVNSEITQKLKRIDHQIKFIEHQAYSNDGNLSIIKQALAQLHYQQKSYKTCATYLNESFQQSIKYGHNKNIRQILKINALVTLLHDEPEIITSDKYNSLYHESSSSLKAQSDIFNLYHVIDAFQQLDLKKIQKYLPEIRMEKNEYFKDIEERIIAKLKKNKLVSIVKSYKKVKLSYLQTRVNQSKKLEQMLFELIADEKIRGILNIEEGYLELKEQTNKYLDIQLKNIRDLSLRY